MPDSKIIAVIIIVVLIAIYFFWKKRTLNTEKVNNKKSGRKSKRKRKPLRSRRINNTSFEHDEDEYDETEQDEDEYDETEQDDITEDAIELYDLVHDRMASGMGSKEFMEIAGDLADDLTFIEIKQLYNDASNKNEDSSQSITVDDYIEVLKKMDAGDP